MKPGLSSVKRGVKGKENEITDAVDFLGTLPLTGQVMTADALWTQRSVCQYVVDVAGADYVLNVKGNQPFLLKEVVELFADNQRRSTSVTETSIHGSRYEERVLEASEDLIGYTDWPHLQQALCVTRSVWSTKRRRNEPLRQEVAYFITSLSAQRASPSRLQELVRGHWTIENRLHWVRDVTMGEDACQIRTGNAPHVMVALRNTVIGLLRQRGTRNIAEALRRHAAKPHEALALIGLSNDRAEG